MNCARYNINTVELVFLPSLNSFGQFALSTVRCIVKCGCVIFLLQWEKLKVKHAKVLGRQRAKSKTENYSAVN